MTPIALAWLSYSMWGVGPPPDMPARVGQARAEPIGFPGWLRVSYYVNLLLMVLLRRQWSALLGFLKSGAPLLVVLLAGPWFAYAQRATHSGQFGHEIDTMFSGLDHPGPELLDRVAAPLNLSIGQVCPIPFDIRIEVRKSSSHVRPE